ncbi:MAG: 30S ribosome-binding factor RbfA [Methyloligellaceae bacterium]
MPRGKSANDPSQRQLRVSEVLRKALSEILLRAEMADPDLSNVSITVSEVRVSPDLRNATAFVLPLGGANEEAVLAALQRGQGFLRGELARRVTLRHIPALVFEADASFDESAKVDSILRSPKVAQDLG